jgi:hypothetical protein
MESPPAALCPHIGRSRRRPYKEMKAKKLKLTMVR